MKMTPDLRNAQARMAPGVISASGFLGHDRRPIADIIEADEQAMSAAELSFEEAAARMRHLLVEGRRGLGEPRTVDGAWLVRVEEARGAIASPFGGTSARKVNVQAYRSDRNVSLTYSELSILMLERQHFLQGRGSPYRLEPAMLKAVLG
jgi:hypothetical protein